MSESTSSRISAWFASLFGSLSLTPQRAMGFASLAVVLTFAAIFAVIQMRHAKQQPPVVAKNSSAPPPAQTPSNVNAGQANPNDGAGDSNNGGNAVAITQPPKDVKAIYRPKARPKQTVDVVSKPSEEIQKPTGTQLLPGEKSYLEAIASLTTAIETSKEDVLKPTVLADYERNLAVVDQAIATTRQQAKRNPNDPDAVEFMYTAYQNKIDLLSAVADQTRIASR